jgi:(2Fe-2S) ferredoxin
MRSVPQRHRYLFVCTNQRPADSPKGSCAARGGHELQARLKAALAERGLFRVEARACASGCQDVCWVGPVIHVASTREGEPAYFYGRVSVDDVPAIADALAAGTRVERLVLAPEDFDEATARR